MVVLVKAREFGKEMLSFRSGASDEEKDYAKKKRGGGRGDLKNGGISWVAG